MPHYLNSRFRDYEIKAFFDVFLHGDDPSDFADHYCMKEEQVIHTVNQVRDYLLNIPDEDEFFEELADFTGVPEGLLKTFQVINETKKYVELGGTAQFEELYDNLAWFISLYFDKN